MELLPNQSAFLGRCEEARRLSLSFKDPLVVHHHDADGVSSGAIVVAAIRDANKRAPGAKCIKKLDDAAIAELEARASAR